MRNEHTAIKPGDLVVPLRGGRVARVVSVDCVNIRGDEVDMLTITRTPCNEHDHCDPHASIDARAVTLVTPNTSTPIVPHESSDGVQRSNAC